MLQKEEPFRLTGVNRSIHFLRGVFSRASLCLPAFYLFLGSAAAREEARSSSDYPFKIAQSYAEFSDLNTITLACRKVFDHATSPDLTGANFGKLADPILREHAEYWAKTSGESESDSFLALQFLRRFFAEYARPHSTLLKADGFLHKRIGLLKQHADRAAAHLSLQDYSLDIVDIAHFTAAIVIVGEIVRTFDNTPAGVDYFNSVDQASADLARRIFPQAPDFRLFGHMKVQQQARFYWRHPDVETIQEYFDQLQWALG
jgi:hypothetical protein